MAPKKKVVGLIKLQIKAGEANPAPPVGPALGQHGVNIMEFCKAYNAATDAQRGNVIPVEITVYEDRSFTFALKTPPAAKLLLKAAGVGKGSAEPNKDKVAKVTWDQVREIAETKKQEQQGISRRGREGGPRQPLPPATSGQAGQGDVVDQAGLDRRGGHPARSRPAQSQPDGPRDGQPAARHR